MRSWIFNCQRVECLTETGDVKAAVAVISFILSNATKFSVDADSLSNELQQLGLPKGMLSVHKTSCGQLREILELYCSCVNTLERFSDGPIFSLPGIALHTYYSSVSTPLPEILDCSFEWGLRTPILGEGEAVGGMAPFERALVSS